MSIEIPKERQIKNLGTRPHNIPYSQLVEKMQNNEGVGQYGVIMLKPGCFSVDNKITSIQDQTEGLFADNNLNVVATSCINLTKEQIHELYPGIFGSNVAAITDRLDELRVLLDDYLSDCVFTYLVYGENFQGKLETIKKILRKRIARVGNWDVNNWIHVPTQKNITQDIEILFNHPNCSICPKLKNE